MPKPIQSVRRRFGRLLATRSAAWRAVLQHLSGSSAFSPTGVESVADLPRERVLVLAPHPDDEIIGPGGTLIRYLDNGSRVIVVYLTDGGGPRATESERQSLVRARRQEAAAVGRRLGFEQIFWEHLDTRLDPEAAAPELVHLLDDFEPDTVYLPSYFEHHFDHYAANALLDRALAVTDARPWICGYEVWDNLPCANRAVDISSELDRKLEAMTLYATPMRYTDFAQLIRHRAALHFLLQVDSRRQAAEGSAEAFLRLAAEDYRVRFRRWDDLLRDSASPLIAHLDDL